MEKEENIRILYKKINQPPKELVIKNDLKTMQKLVDGLIEVVPYMDNILMICNEEGKICNKPINLVFDNDLIAGDCFFVRDSKSGNFSSLKSKEIDKIKDDIKNRSIVYKGRKELAVENEL